MHKAYCNHLHVLFRCGKFHHFKSAIKSAWSNIQRLSPPRVHFNVRQCHHLKTQVVTVTGANELAYHYLFFSFLCCF